MASSMRRKPGFALDLTQVDEHDGEPWELSKAEKRKRAEAKIDAEEPFILVASPMCAKFCALQALSNYRKESKETVTEAAGAAGDDMAMGQLAMRQRGWKP